MVYFIPEGHVKYMPTNEIIDRSMSGRDKVPFRKEREPKQIYSACVEHKLYHPRTTPSKDPSQPLQKAARLCSIT